MKIIDAHLHLCQADEYFDQIAVQAGHENSAGHLAEQYEKRGISCGIVMGNRGLQMENHRYPDFLRYCIGLDSSYLTNHQLLDEVDQVEEHLKSSQCVGVKLYPGYSRDYITAPAYDPIYRLAEKYEKAVAVHTGLTAGANAVLKYSHPLVLDEVAVKYPSVRFVMCHFGNPWLADAAAVLDKNPNVAADLSGLLEGRVNLDNFFEEKSGYIQQLRAWLGYLPRYERIMYGTDWPLVNLEEYRAFIERLVPEKYYEKIFFTNANEIYKLGL